MPYSRSPRLRMGISIAVLALFFHRHKTGVPSINLRRNPDPTHVEYLESMGPKDVFALSVRTSALVGALTRMLASTLNS